MNVTAGSVLPCEADPLRRPQRPGNPARAFTLSGTLPAIHPRESPGTVVLSRCTGQTLNYRACVKAICVSQDSVSSKNCIAFVQKLWTTGICCGKRRKSGIQVPVIPQSPAIGRNQCTADVALSTRRDSESDFSSQKLTVVNRSRTAECRMPIAEC